MDLAPDLVLLEVFSFVSVEKKFTTLRLVCKRWKQVVEFQIQRELVVYQREHPLKVRWPSDNRQINPLNAAAKPFFDFGLINNHYRSIKRLFLSQVAWTGFKPKGLLGKLVKCICQLEELSIDQDVICPFKEELYGGKNQSWSPILNRLTLTDLKVLSVKQDFKRKISITAPRLEKLVIWDYDYSSNQTKGLMIALSHPEVLKSLQCQQIDQKMRAFPNLVQLSAQYVKPDFELSHHPKLKRLDLYISRPSLENPFNFHTTIERLLKQRAKLKLEHLEITNFGVKDAVINNPFNLGSSPGRFYLNVHDIGNLIENPTDFTIDYLPWKIWSD